MWTSPCSIRRLPPLLLVLAGCPAEDEPIPADPDGGSADSGTTEDPGATSEEPTTGQDTTAGQDESTEGPAEGECVGFTATTNLGRVLARDGLPIDPTCDPEPAPCGGDVVGTWAIEGICGIEELTNPFAKDCTGPSAFYVEYLNLEGSYTFEADGTYAVELTQELLFHLELDTMECYGIDCATFEADSADVIDNLSCQQEGMQCHCTFGDPPSNSSWMGTYEVMGDEIVQVELGVEQRSPFCVDGDRLALWETVYDVETPGLLCNDSTDCEVLEGYDFALCTTDLPEDPGSGG